MDKQIIIDKFINNKGKIIGQRTNINYLKKHGYYDYLINYYNDSVSIKETIYRIYHNLDTRPVCKMCGKPVNLHNYGFSTYCSKKCQNTDPDMLKINSLQVSKSLTKAYKERGKEIKEKRIKTLKEKYQTDNITSPFSIQSIQEKSKQTIQKRYNVDTVLKLKKFRETRESMQTRSIEYQKTLGYDISYEMINDLLYVNVKNGCTIHGDIQLTHVLFNNRTREDRKNYTVLCPICNPIGNKETSIETIIKDLLKKYNINFVEHDREQINPYELDFYLPDYNIGIECNGIYWHAGYDNYLKHLNKFQLCQDKNITLIFYWSYEIYNDIDNVEIDLLNHLNLNHKINNNLIILNNELKSDYSLNRETLIYLKNNYRDLQLYISKEKLMNYDDLLISDNETSYKIIYINKKTEEIELQEKLNTLDIYKLGYVKYKFK